MSEEVKASSPNQPLLDSYVAVISEKVSAEAIKEAYINEANGHMPTLIIDKKNWTDVVSIIRDDENLKFNYLMNLSGVDYEQYMEVVYHLYSYSRDAYLTVKVQTERDGGSVPTVIGIWTAADWQERETYDLLGIGFTGRQITRILLPDEWIGHPLRKDYVPHDEGV